MEPEDEDLLKPQHFDNDGLAMGKDVSDTQMQMLRRVGMGVLLAGVFVPFDLLAFMVILGAGVHTCVRVVMYLRHAMALHRSEG